MSQEMLAWKLCCEQCPSLLRQADASHCMRPCHHTGASDAAKTGKTLSLVKEHVVCRRHKALP